MQAMRRFSIFAIIILSFSILCSCTGQDKLLKSTDNEAKFEAAMKFYNEKRYNRARELFENLMLYYHGREHAEDIAWYYGQSLYHTGHYYTAGYQFLNFTKRYPYSTRAEDAAYMSAYCKYMESPEYTLDQSITKDAIAEFELFAERYPQSIHIPEVNNYLDEMRGKLMRKEYEIAIGYYNVESYQAAVVALNNFLNNYPESPNREDAMYYIIKSGFEFAINSREDKMTERLQQVINNFDKFATTFKNSKYMSDCQNIYTKCKEKLNELENAGIQ